MTILIFGLGNPDEEYQETRHNLGKKIVNFFHQKLEKKYSFSPFEDYKKNAFISKGKFEKKKTILAYSKTFVNQSGKAVKELSLDFKVKPENIWLIHDDLDLPLGKIRIRKRGSTHHKGVQSIISSLKTEEFARLRIGIGFKKKIDAKDIVLGNFSPKEKKEIEKVIEKTILALKMGLEENIDKAMSVFNA